MAIFLTGASGFIGGSIAHQFLLSGHKVRALVRSEERMVALRERGIDPILGSLEDFELLAREAAASDAVVHCAKAEDIAPARALLSGLQGSGKTYLHISGTGMVASAGDGNTVNPAVFDEKSDLDTASPRQTRRDIDKFVLAAAERAIRTIIVCPPSIFGHSEGIKRNSSQIPFLIRNARQRQAVTIIGNGSNIWSQVHIDDLTALVALAYDRSPAGSFYFAGSCEASFHSIAEALEDRLSLGAIKSLTIDEAVRDWGEGRARYVFGGNSRVKSKRARSELGWAPTHLSVESWIRNEMEL